MVDILSAHGDAAGHAQVARAVVHPVQALERGGLAASRRADEGQYLGRVQVEGHILQGLLVAVPQVQFADADDRVGIAQGGVHNAVGQGVVFDHRQNPRAGCGQADSGPESRVDRGIWIKSAKSS
jgi:hypothetical protein